MKLYIGNKNYSSWSMRPWVLLRQAGIPFEEVMVRFDDFEAGSAFKTAMAAVSPVQKVPVLVDGDLVIWDSLAIAEYLAERFPDQHLWPQAVTERARARSICAEMHAGFGALRQHCGMNLEADFRALGPTLMAEHPGIGQDLARIVQMWSDLLTAHGGPLLFGRFSIADAYYAPVATRIRTYGLPVPPAVDAYITRVLALPAVQEWTHAALQEQHFVAIDEPYRSAR